MGTVWLSKNKNMASMIVTPEQFIPSEHMIFTKPKVNASGGKSIGIINSTTKRSIMVHTPLMLTWGVNVFENAYGPSYSMSLQFPRDEFATKATNEFLEMLNKMETQVKEEAFKNSKEWFGKVQSKEVIEAFWNPILKYPKDENSEPDKSRSPTIKVKLQKWENEFKFELFDNHNVMLLPNSSNTTPEAIIAKGCNVACILQCGGLWFANGNFGVSWKLSQAMVKANETLVKGKCHIALSVEDQEQLQKDQPTSPPEHDTNNAVVESDDEEVEEASVEDDVSNENGEEVETAPVEADTEPEPEPEPEKPKKKRVVKKKA